MNKNKSVIFFIGVVVLFVAAGIYVDRSTQDWFHEKELLQNAQENSSSVPGIDFKNYGKAPDFAGGGTWLNSDKKSITDLKGKVVLVDFWTYSCINCIRTLPHVTKWYETYKDKGLVIVGVHTPEFAFEKETDNVRSAMKNLGVDYPVVQDNDYNIWNEYNNHYWPAEYLIDQNGNIVYTHFGEGNYDHTENAIRSLLGLDMEALSSSSDDLSKIASPEMYFGTDRLQNLTSEQQPSVAEQNYSFPKNLDLNNFALEGSWKFSAENAIAVKAGAKIRLKFRSGKVHFVAESDKPLQLKVTVDNVQQSDVSVQKSQLYTLFNSKDYTEHLLEIIIPDAGLKAFTFTFG